MVLERDDHVTHAVLVNQTLKRSLRRHCWGDIDDLEMVRVIGRIARLAENAQCTSCHACEISGWFRHQGSHGAKEILERAWIGRRPLTGFANSNAKKNAWRMRTRLERVSETMCKEVSVSLPLTGDSHDQRYDDYA